MPFHVIQAAVPRTVFLARSGVSTRQKSQQRRPHSHRREGPAHRQASPMVQPHVELNPPRTETGTAAWDPPSLHGEMKRKGRKKNGSAVAELIRWPDGESHGLYKRTPTSSSTPRIEPNRAGAETITRETNNSSRAVPSRPQVGGAVLASSSTSLPFVRPPPPVPRSDRRRLIWTAG
jgi:hypothetical protein